MDYCNLNTDLASICPNIFDYIESNFIVVENWELATGQTYTYMAPGPGIVSAVLEDDFQLTGVASIAAVEAAAGSWYFDANTNILYVRTTGSDIPTDNYTIQAGEDTDGLLTRYRDEAQEEVDGYLNGVMETPLRARSRLTHSSRLLESMLIRATAALVCYRAVFPTDSAKAIEYSKIAINPNPEPGEMTGILDKFVSGQFKREDDVSAREAANYNVFPASDNTTPNPGVMLEGDYNGATFQIWRLTITTGGAPGTAKFSLSLDGGTTTLYTNRDTKVNDDLYVNLSQGVRARFPAASYTVDDYYDIEVYPLHSTLKKENTFQSFIVER